ncbi:GNAT family N-acetyltransferase [Hymenobacter gummosus]|uniref:GNAT family N-acetyltransferase n=1 Tax=Hymenobacter gummosus TaxID=1776032 RepID=UPI0014054455|nr:GNAT family N-acetyltransferase [Hymenobacter gummosus]
MPLRYLAHSFIDRAAWDDCVRAAEQVVPYAQSGWLDATNAGPFDAVVEPDPSNGGYRSILPVPTQRRLWGREALQPPFTQQLGLLTTAGSQHREVGEYLAPLKGEYARLHLQLNDATPVPAAVPTGWQLTERRTYHLPLAADYEAIRAGYCADYRRRLRQLGERANISIQEVAGADALVRLFQREKGGEVGGMKQEYYQRLQRLSEWLHGQGQSLLLHAHATDTAELLAGALFVRYRGRLVYLFAAATPAGKKAAAPLLLLDEAIRCHAATPGLVLDFEGGMIPSIARFFANFGARPVPYYTLTQTTRPWYLTWMR